MNDQRKSELFIGLLKSFDGLLDDKTCYDVLRGIGMTHQEMEAEGLDLREQYPRQSPALSELSEKLSGLANHLAGECMELLGEDDRASLYLYGEARKHGVDVSYSEALRQTIIDMVGERLEGLGLDMEFDNGDLIVTRAEPEMGLEM